MALFNDALPYYWATADEYPPLLVTGKLEREANRALIQVQNFVEMM